MLLLLSEIRCVSWLYFCLELTSLLHLSKLLYRNAPWNYLHSNFNPSFPQSLWNLLPSFLFCHAPDKTTFPSLQILVCYMTFSSDHFSLNFLVTFLCWFPQPLEWKLYVARFSLFCFLTFLATCTYKNLRNVYGHAWNPFIGPHYLCNTVPTPFFGYRFLHIIS